jgi:hypothetical protein
MNDKEEQIITIDEAMAMDEAAELDATLARLQSGKEALLAKMAD